MASLQEKIRAERLHPFTEPQFERMNSINPPSCDYLKTPVVWNEDVYALGRDHNQDGKLFKYSITNNGWSEFSVLSSIYASNSALITYRSKLLLISGEGMSVWEFNSNDLAFKPSSIKPVPTEYAHSYSFFTAISRDKYLVTVCMLKTLRCCFDIAQLIYDGQDWKFREYGKFTFCSGYSIQCVINSHATLIFLFNDLIVNFDSIVKIWKAPILSNDESKVSAINWEVLDISLLQIPDYRYPPILHDQKLYFVNSKGDIRISFIQSPLLPEVWGNSGVNFRRAPHIIGLPNGTLLMTGMVGEQDEAQLDVIKVTQKDCEFNPDDHFTMLALITLEWEMNIPVLTKLCSKLSDLKDKLKLEDTCAKLFRNRWSLHSYNTGTTFKLSNIIEYIKSWISSTDCVLAPTWRNFFGILKDISPKLGYQIKEIFHATDAADDVVKLKADLVHLQGSSKSAEEMEKELYSSVALCEYILQKVQKADEEIERLAMQLRSKEKEVIELSEQLKLLKQAEKKNETQKLTEKDLPSLLRQLKKHASKWREIGIHLEFLPGELDNIEARPTLSQGAPVSWFGAMLESWLQWAPGDNRGSTNFATLENLMDALSKAGLGASAHDLTLQSVQIAPLVQHECEATGIPESRSLLKLPRLSEPMSSDNDRNHTEEVAESDRHCELLLECSNEPQHFAGAPIPRLPSPEIKANQCLLQ